MEKIELVFIPTFGVGHLISMVEFGNLLMSRYPNLSSTFLIIKFKGTTPVDVPSVLTSAAAAVHDSSTRTRFLEISRDDDDDTTVLDPGAMFDFLNLYKPIIKETVERKVIDRSGSVRLAGFILDMFCAGMMDMVKEFNVPGHVFFSSGASFLGLLWHLQSLQIEHGRNLVDLDIESDVELDVPVFMNRYPLKVIPHVVVDKDGGGSEIFLRLAQMLREVDGMAVNTFAELESHAVRVLSEDEKIPPIYPVGPILKLKKETDEKFGDAIRWLDGQPPSSVIFLCFGSMGTFPEEQVKEIAHALESVGKRFLWSIRRESSTDKRTPWITTDYEDPSEVLPEGFLDRTAEIGRVIGWAPQVEVLSHEAVGGFVSHCGWNSTLETVWFGVPTATWPIQAEQNMNAFFMVKEVGLSVEVKMDYRQSQWNGSEETVTVPAAVIENGLRRLMDESGEECLEMRRRMKEMSQKSRTAVAEGGSSYVSIGRFVDNIALNKTKQ